MENRPPPPQEAGPQNASKPKLSTSNRLVEMTARVLLYMTQHHPIIFWTGSWLGMALIAWVAMTGLTYTNTAPLEVAASPEPTTLASPYSNSVQRSHPSITTHSPHSEPQFQSNKPATSFGLFAAVAASCAAASVLLGRQLRPVKPTSKRGVRRLSESRLATQSTTTNPERTARRLTKQVPQEVAPSSPTAEPSVQPTAATTLRPINAKDTEIKKPASKPNTTAIPDDETILLDWGDANFVDMMDMRRPDSISLEL
jgi:hypothetical protein